MPHGDRGNVPLEPWLTDQWYVDAKTLAAPAIKAVEEGRTRFVPEQWSNTYFEWMRNIQPWCISRQLWWGHQIPAWYGPDGKIFVEETEERGAPPRRASITASEVPLRRDEDVLDTWFSSALWPFSTLGWPEQTPELKRYYPDRRAGHRLRHHLLLGRPDDDDGHALHGRRAVPRRLHPRPGARRASGQKMSKTKGNVIDPLDLIDDYGADALRFTLAIAAAQGRDIKLSENRVEGYRNFATKLWNAARFCQMNDCARRSEVRSANACSQPVNRWIVGETANARRRGRRARSRRYRFNDAAGAALSLRLGQVLRLVSRVRQAVLDGERRGAKAETRATAAWVLDQLLHLLHPFMPFVTEELWRARSAAAGR